MRYLVLAALLLLSGCYYPPYGGYYYGGYPYAAPYPYAPYGYSSAPAYHGSYAPPPGGPGSPYGGSYAPPPQGSASPYGGAPQLQYGIPGPYDPQNCGTPDEPRPCGHGG